MHPLIRLIRVPNSLLMGLAVIAGSVIAGGFWALHNYIQVIFLGFLTGFLLTGASMVLNDIYDLEIDKINMPHRPLPAGEISVRRAWLLYIVLSISGLMVSFYISSLSFLIAFSSWALSSLYNIRLKRLGLPGNVIVSYVVSVPIIYGSAIIQMLGPKILIFSSMVFLSCLGREIVKGIADIEGDRAMGVMTLAVERGARFASIVASSLIVLAVLISPLPYVLGLVGVYYLVLVSLADMLFLYSSYIILIRQDKQAAFKSKRWMLIAMGIGLAAFIFSTTY